MSTLPELIIGPSEGRPRTLRISWLSTHINVAVYDRTGFGQRISFSTTTHDATRLDLSYSRLLWLDGTCFDLSESEALQVRTVLGPHGLRIETRESAHSAALSSAADYETAVAADLSSPGNNGGTPPPRFSSFGGPPEVALDDENPTLVHALTCGEHY